MMSDHKTSKCSSDEHFDAERGILDVVGDVVEATSEVKDSAKGKDIELHVGKEGILSLPHRDHYSSEGNGEWSSLPEDIVSRVLARLPVPELLRARAVCKNWHTLLSSPGFLEEELTSNELYFPAHLSRRSFNKLSRIFFGYDHTMKKWQRMPPLDFLPLDAQVPVAASGGLLCFRGDRSLFICNPVSRTYKELPLITYKWPPSVSVHIMVDQSTKSYKVIIAGKIRHNFVTDSFRNIVIYESTTSLWRVVDAPHPPKVFSYGPTAVVCNDILYCEAICHGGELGVMAYDVQGEVWLDNLHEIPYDDNGDFQLTQVVECGGSVFMVLGRGFGGIITAVHILKLKKLTNVGTRIESDSENSLQSEDVWSKVTTLSPELLEDLRNVWFGDDDAEIVCVGHGTQICIVAGTSLLLVYDVQLGLWNKVQSFSQILSQIRTFGYVEPIQFPIELRFDSPV